MTPEIALAYARKRVQELKLGQAWSMRLRHFALAPKSSVKVHGQGQRFILADAAEDVSITSDAGVFDLTIDYANELVYEHLGDMQIRNHSPGLRHIRFIQIIPHQ